MLSNHWSAFYPDPSEAPFIINRSAGASYLYWKSTGSRLSILPPSPESFRGDAFDLIIIDESQEIEAGDESTELYGAILPTLDTRPGAQLVLLGTAGVHRSGLFWDTLEKGRAGLADFGILEWALPEDVPLHSSDDHEDQDLTGTTADPDMWRLAHPGIGNLTPLDAVRRNFDALTPVNFAREYLGIWPTGKRASFLDFEKWEKGVLEGEAPLPPKDASIAIYAHKDQTWASIVCAWRDEKGLAHIVLMDHRKGMGWVTDRAGALALKRGVAVSYDSQWGVSGLLTNGLQRLQPRPRTNPMAWVNVSTASELFVKELNDGNLRHWVQPELDNSVPLVAKWTNAKTKRWQLGAVTETDDHTPIAAAALALYAYDQNPKREAPRIWA